MPRLAATLSAPLVATAALAVAHAGAAVAPAAPTDADGVVRIHVPAATAPAAPAEATADGQGVVIRAQNRAGRGFSRSSSQPQPQARPAVRRSQPRQVQPPPRPMNVQPVSNVVEHHPGHGGYEMTGPPAPAGAQPHAGPHSGPHGAYADCPQCYGQCPPQGCPTCYGVPGLPTLPPCGRFGPGHGPGFQRGGTFVPRHQYEYEYNAPKGLLYPPGADPNVPGKMGPMPMVQYPYYTTKGPDDYFHDRDGEF